MGHLEQIVQREDQKPELFRRLRKLVEPITAREARESRA